MKRPSVSTLAAVVISVVALSAQPPAFPRVPVPKGNPVTPDKVMLGKALFFEEQMSSSRTMACATCHIFKTGGADPRSFARDSIHPGRDGKLGTPDDVRGSKGLIRSVSSGAYERSKTFGLNSQVTERRAAPVINAAFARSLFWDGRAANVFRSIVSGNVLLTENAALESQASEPPVSDVEMCSVGDTWTRVVDRIRKARPLALATRIPAALTAFIGNRGYPALFRKAFGKNGNNDVTADRIVMAIATYERTLISNQSPFDDFLRGNRNALTTSQRRGFDIFQRRCDGCHQGVLLTDHHFHNTGVRPVIEDTGWQRVTKRVQDRGRFKTPGLRNVELRAPYFHNGGMRTLMDVVAFYNRGGDFNDNKDRRMIPLGLNRGQRQDVVNFMGSLTDPRVRNELPPFDRPTLYTESNRVPSLIGAGTAGSLGVVPRVIAVQPPWIGNAGLTIGIHRGLANAPAVLGLDGLLSRTGVRIGGARVYLGLSAALVVVPFGNLNAQGYGSLTFAVPNDPRIRGLVVYGQWLLLDRGAGRTFAATAMFQARLF